MAKLRLFSYWRSSCSYRVRIALNLKGATYEYHPVHLLNNGGEHLQLSYQKVNPAAKVPTLMVDDVPICESMAIMFYLDQVFPESLLFPEQALKKAHVIRICELINSSIQPLQNLGVLNELDRRFSIGKKGKTSWSAYWINQGFVALESILAPNDSSFCAGEQISAADCFLIPQVYNANRFQLDMNQFPTLAKINQNCLQHPAFADAVPERMPDAVVT